MNQNEQARLAAAVAILRPDWPQDSIRTFVSRDDQLLGKRPFQDAAVALVFVALDPETKTPARVNENGPWWHIGHSERTPPSATRCDRCGHAYMPTEDHTCRKPSKRDERHELVEQVKADVLAPLNVECRHHQPRRLCRECLAEKRPELREENA